MVSKDDLLIPDSMIPDIDGTSDFEENPDVEEEEDNYEEMAETFAELLSYPIATVEDLVIGLDDNEFQDKYTKYRNRALQTGFAKNLAKYLEESGVDWLNDPRIGLAISGLMFFAFVGIDFKKTMERKKKEKRIEEAKNTRSGVQNENGGEKE